MYQNKYHLDVKYFYSQDGATWIDLPPVAPEIAADAKRFASSLLSGDAAKVYEDKVPLTAEEIEEQKRKRKAELGEDDEEEGEEQAPAEGGRSTWHAALVAALAQAL